MLFFFPKATDLGIHLNLRAEKMTQIETIFETTDFTQREY